MTGTSAFKDKTLMITGGTGSFGNTVLKHFMNTDLAEIRFFSRDTAPALREGLAGAVLAFSNHLTESRFTADLLYELNIIEEEHPFPAPVLIKLRGQLGIDVKRPPRVVHPDDSAVFAQHRPHFHPCLLCQDLTDYQIELYARTRFVELVDRLAVMVGLGHEQRPRCIDARSDREFTSL